MAKEIGGVESPGMKTPKLEPGEYMESARHCEDGGEGSPSEWGKGGTRFSVGKSTAGAGTSVKVGVSVDLESGQISPVATGRK